MFPTSHFPHAPPVCCTVGMFVIVPGRVWLTCSKNISFAFPYHAALASTAPRTQPPIFDTPLQVPIAAELAEPARGSDRCQFQFRRDLSKFGRYCPKFVGAPNLVEIAPVSVDTAQQLVDTVP